MRIFVHTRISIEAYNIIRVYLGVFDIDAFGFLQFFVLLHASSTKNFDVCRNVLGLVLIFPIIYFSIREGMRSPLE